MTYLSLRALPIDHPLRNRPLAEIGARYCNVHSGRKWTEVRGSFGIAGATYNQLGSAWTENNDFQAPAEALP